MQVDVLTSGIWQTSSTILHEGGACLVVDPAYFPRELEAIAARVAELGHAEGIVFTHGHWDHVMGHTALPGAPVWLAATLDRAIASGDPRAAKYLDDAREFDSRWYVPRPGHAWPAARRPLAEGDTLTLGASTIRALHLPGHSPDDTGLVVETLGLLLVGDYLSPCEIPFVEDLGAYRSTLRRLVELLGSLHEVIPGHGPRLTAAEAIAIARADLDYLARLEAAPTLEAALAIALPRAAEVVGMREAHEKNCRLRFPQRESATTA